MIMLGVAGALGLLALTLACLGGAGVVAGWLIAECLDERDRRRHARLDA
jgi:hypothetical protein